MTIPISTLSEKTGQNPAFGIPDGAKILIVCGKFNPEKDHLETVLLEKGLASECAHSITEACEAVKSGRFQVVVASPSLEDGSWRRLTDIARHHDLCFEIILWAHNLDFSEWKNALDIGAFDVLDAVHEQSKIVEVTKCALWAAYLKGAGPVPTASA